MDQLLKYSVSVTDPLSCTDPVWIPNPLVKGFGCNCSILIRKGLSCPPKKRRKWRKLTERSLDFFIMFSIFQLFEKPTYFLSMHRTLRSGLTQVFETLYLSIQHKSRNIQVRGEIFCNLVKKQRVTFATSGIGSPVPSPLLTQPRLHLSYREKED